MLFLVNLRGSFVKRKEGKFHATRKSRTRYGGLRVQGQIYGIKQGDEGRRHWELRLREDLSEVEKLAHFLGRIL